MTGRVPPGRHANWCRCAGCRADITRHETSLLKADAVAVAALFIIAGVAWIALAPLRIWHVTGPDGQIHPDGATWAAYGIGGVVILAGLMWFSIRAAGKAPAAPAVKPPAPAVAPEPVRCAHDGAVPVEDMTGQRVAWLCPGCDAQLDPAARSAELSPDTTWAPVRKARPVT